MPDAAPGARDLRSLVVDGEISLAAVERRVPYVFTIDGAVIFDAEFGIAKDGTDIVVFSSSEGGDWDAAGVFTASKYVLKVIPALMDALERIRFSPELSFDPKRQVRYLRAFAFQAWRFFCAPEHLHHQTTLDLDELTGWELFILGLTPSFPWLTSEHLRTLCEIFSRSLECWIPYGYTPESGHAPHGQVLKGSLATGPFPEEYSALARVAGHAGLVNGAARADVVLALMALAAADSPSYLTLRQVMEDMPPLEKSRLAWKYARETARCGSSWNFSWWDYRNWLDEMPEDVLPLLAGFTSQKARVFLSRAPFVEQPESLGMLARMISSGQLRKELDPADHQEEEWTPDYGLADWVTSRLRKAVGTQEARRLLELAAEEFDDGLPAATWAAFIKDADNLKGMPISWWAELHGDR